MSLLRACAIGLSMYSKIPMPQFEWKEEDMRYAICFFPLVGAAVGALTVGWLALAARLKIGTMAAALVAAVIPVIVTGGIHVDGYMDTSDALSSWRSREKRLEILKDSHVGAFAVIMLAVLSALYLAAASEIVRGVCAAGVAEAGGRSAAESAAGGAFDLRTALLWGLTFVFARTLSGLSVVFFKNAKKEGTLCAFASHRKTAQIVMIVETAAAAVLMIACSPVRGLVCAIGGLAVFAYYRYRSYRDFGGITGDLAGWFLCLAELTMAILIAALCLGG